MHCRALVVLPECHCAFLRGGGIIYAVIRALSVARTFALERMWARRPQEVLASVPGWLIPGTSRLANSGKLAIDRRAALPAVTKQRCGPDDDTCRLNADLFSLGARPASLRQRHISTSCRLLGYPRRGQASDIGATTSVGDFAGFGRAVGAPDTDSFPKGSQRTGSVESRLVSARFRSGSTKLFRLLTCRAANCAGGGCRCWHCAPRTPSQCTSSFPHPESRLPGAWTWERGDPRDIARRACARDTMPGTGGLGYSIWTDAPNGSLEVLDDITEAVQDGGPLPLALHSSLTVLIPEAELLADPDDVRPTAYDALEPHSNRRQRRTRAGRGAHRRPPTTRLRCGPPRLRRHDQPRRRHGCLDYARRMPRCSHLVRLRKHVPGFRHSWIFAVARQMGKPVRLINIIAALYRDLTTDMCYAGVADTSIDLLVCCARSTRTK